MLLDDRLVGTFGTVAAGDKEKLVRIAVEAFRRGFALVPMQADAVNPACALTAAQSKKPHDCYHVLSSDTSTDAKVRAAFKRLVEQDPRTNLAIDVEASNIGFCTDISWWVGPEISPTLLGLDGEEIYVFDLTGCDPPAIPDPMIITGTLLVPPTADEEAGDYIQLVGQINRLSDNVRKEEPVTEEQSRELWETRPAEETEQNERIESLEFKIGELTGTVEALTEKIGKIQDLVVAMANTIVELRDNKE